MLFFFGAAALRDLRRKYVFRSAYSALSTKIANVEDGALGFAGAAVES